MNSVSPHSTWESSLENTVAIVTGGGSEIGKAVAFRLGRAGASLAICGRNEQPLQETAEALKRENIQVHSWSCDISVAEEVHSFVRQVTDRYGPPHVLARIRHKLSTAVPQPSTLTALCCLGLLGVRRKKGTG